MADESLSDAFGEIPIEDPVLASVVSLRDRLPACEVRTLILDNFSVTAVKSAKKLLWSARQAVSRRFCGIKVKLAGGRILLVVCVYLPFDDGHASDVLKFGEVLGELEAFLYPQSYDLLAVVGDFNVDFSRTHRSRTGELLRFMQTACLEASDLHFPSIQFTYESDSGLARSWVDHFFFQPRPPTWLSASMWFALVPICLTTCLCLYL